MDTATTSREESDELSARFLRCQQQTAGTELDLSNLGLREVPLEAASFFPGLRRLNLRNNAIELLPDDFSRLFPHLVSLNAAENAMKVLPEHFGTLRHLQKLTLARNQLHGLPLSFSHLHALEELNLSSNQLQALDKEIGAQLIKLKTFNVANNQIDEIPPAFANLSSLRTVDLSGNDSMVTVPEKIRRLHEQNVILHSRSKRRELISRALRVRNAVHHTMAITTTVKGSPKKRSTTAATSPVKIS